MPRVSKDYIDNFGRPPQSPWMTGEQASSTSALTQGINHEQEISGAAYDWSEPQVKVPMRSTNTVVFQAKNGGNSIVVNDEGSDGSGFMLITHNSGTVVQIDDQGTVLIKSTGDTHNNTMGLHYQRSRGDTNVNVGGSWNVKVERGAHNLWVRGDVNIECENYNVTARGKITMNAGEAFEARAARYSIEAHTDNVDLIARNVKLKTTETFNVIAGQSASILAETSLNFKAKEDMFLQNENFHHLTSANSYVKVDGNRNEEIGGELILGSGGELKLSGENVRIYGETVFVDDIVRLAEGGASETSPESAEEGIGALDAVTAELPDVPARGPSDNSSEGLTDVRPAPLSASGRQYDDNDADAEGS